MADGPQGCNEIRMLNAGMHHGRQVGRQHGRVQQHSQQRNPSCPSPARHRALHLRTQSTSPMGAQWTEWHGGRISQDLLRSCSSPAGNARTFVPQPRAGSTKWPPRTRFQSRHFPRQAICQPIPLQLMQFARRLLTLARGTCGSMPRHLRIFRTRTQGRKDPNRCACHPPLPRHCSC